MAKRGSTRSNFRGLEEIVESHIFIPLETSDENILPCIHVLCKSCVETVSSRTRNKAGDKLICVVCKLQFEVPSIEALHKRMPVAELLLEFSKAANDIQPLCEKSSCTWNEVNRRSASTYCTLCQKYACYPCADKQHQNHHQSVEKTSHWTGKPPNFEICPNHKWHVKQLEVFCIVCYKVGCFISLVENLPDGIKKDCDKILTDEIQSLNELSEKFRAIKTQVENKIKFESWKKETEKRIDADYRELKKAEEKHKNEILYKLTSFNTQVMKNLEQQIGKQAGHLDSSATEHEIQIKTSYEEGIKAIESHRNSLMDQLNSVITEGMDELQQKKNNIDTLLKTVDSYRRSCDSMQSRRKTEEKFCAIGAILKKAEELKAELSNWIEQTHPRTSNESPALNKSFKTDLQWKSKII